jgi:hypothetical protein
MIRQPRRCPSECEARARRPAFVALLLVQISGGLVMTNMASGVELKARVLAQNASEISLQYVLDNSSASRIFVFDQLLYFDSKGATRLAETGAYVFLDGERTARIVRGIIAPPMYMSVARRPPIVASPVDAGATRNGTIKLALPMSEVNPYFPPQECDPKSARSVTLFRVQVGWVEEREGMKMGSFVVDGKALVRLSGGWGSPIQRVAETEVSVKGVGICSYPGRFDRPQLQK